MKIIITKDCLSSDTFTTQKHYAGDVVDLREFTASGLINRGDAIVWQSDLQAQFIKASLPPRKVTQGFPSYEDMKEKARAKDAAWLAQQVEA